MVAPRSAPYPRWIEFAHGEIADSLSAEGVNDTLARQIDNALVRLFSLRADQQEASLLDTVELTRIDREYSEGIATTATTHTHDGVDTPIVTAGGLVPVFGLDVSGDSHVLHDGNDILLGRSAL